MQTCEMKSKIDPLAEMIDYLHVFCSIEYVYAESYVYLLWFRRHINSQVHEPI